MVIDRTKYMDKDEVKQLRRSAEAQAFRDLKKARVNGVRAWMLVDLALSTDLRVSEMAALKIKDVDLKRGRLSVTRMKRKKKVKESLALGKDLAQHLKAYITWTDRKSGPLFMGARGSLTAQGLQRIWKRSIKLAGLPRELSVCSFASCSIWPMMKSVLNYDITMQNLPATLLSFLLPNLTL